jgi:hypothetical protein
LLWGKSPGNYFGSGKTSVRSLARHLSPGQRQFTPSSNAAIFADKLILTRRSKVREHRCAEKILRHRSSLPKASYIALPAKFMCDVKTFPRDASEKRCAEE